jgi:hypothetical protein
MKTYVHPDECSTCSGTLIEMLQQKESDGYTIGVRICPALKARNGEAVQADGKCPKKHMLPGMDNRVLAQGGIQCELKAEHTAGCIITLEQATMLVKMEISRDEEKPPRIISQTPTE